MRSKRFENLGLPSVVADLCNKPRGLILVTGPTGSGKSTTLASMVDKINDERHEHILTIEDPIEFLHNHKSCVVNQREVTSDTHGFGDALRTALRQDPDVVLVGEMRDLETIEMALRIAETGHLTFATLHTNSALLQPSTVSSTFFRPVSSHRSELSFRSFLKEFCVKRFCRKLLATDVRWHLKFWFRILLFAILIREDKIHQIYSMMQTGQDKFGMQTFNQSLATLYQKRHDQP